MGKFTKWARRHWEAVIPISLAAGVYFAVIHPKGESVKQEADGVLSAEEGHDVVYSFLSKDRLNSFTPELNGFVNDFDVFAEQEFLANGLDSYRFSSRLSISWESFWGKIMPASRTGYSPSQSTIFVINSNKPPLEFIATFQHEAGHAKGGLLGAGEYPSTAYDFYSLLRMYSFNRDIGSLYIDRNFSHIMSQVGGWGKEERSPYAYGVLNFLIQANKEEGNLEKAVAGILDSYPWNDYSKEVEKAVSAYGGAYETFYNEFSALIHQQGFRQGLERHLSAAQAEEYIDFLRIKALGALGFDAEYETNSDKVITGFIEKYKDNPDFNPYFMEKALGLNRFSSSFAKSDINYSEIAQSYMSRFYPDGNIRFRPDAPLISYVTPKMAQFAGEFELDASDFELSNGNFEEYRLHICNAINWYSKVIESSCSRISNPELNKQCLSVVSYFENEAGYYISHCNAILAEKGLACGNEQ